MVQSVLHIEITTDTTHLFVQMDASMKPGEVYLPAGKMTWMIPSGEHRKAYCPNLFEAEWHIITARVMTDEEIGTNRNIACNPADLRGETDFYTRVCF